MMKHIDEDKLQQYILEILDPDEKSSIELHIAECTECMQNLNKIRQQTEIIGSFEPEIELPIIEMPMQKIINFKHYFKIAAVFAVGFALGAILFGQSKTEYLTVVRHNIKTNQPKTIFPHFSPFEPVDLEWEIYMVD